MESPDYLSQAHCLMLDKITALIGNEQIDHIVPKARKRLMHGWKRERSRYGDELGNATDGAAASWHDHIKFWRQGLRMNPDL